jgi:UDP-glucose 4-epimerase
MIANVLEFPKAARSSTTASVLVIGAGFIGSRIVRRSLDQGFSVTVLTRSAPQGSAASLMQGADFIVGDAGVTATVRQAIEAADHVVFALSSLMPGEAEQEPQLDMSLMLQPLLELLTQLSERPLPLTLLSSGGTVYGQSDHFPIPESAPTVPLSSYGITRLTAERFVLRYGVMNAAKVRVLRIGNAYGPGQVTARGQGIVGTVLEHCLAGTPITVFGDGSVARDFVHVDDIASATVGLLPLQVGPSIVNVASGTSVTLNEVHSIVQEVTGRNLTFDHRDARPFDVPKVQLDIELLKSLIPFEARPLEEGIRDTWLELLSHQADSDRHMTRLPNVS